jgi:phosphotriesterase-related protein
MNRILLFIWSALLLGLVACKSDPGDRIMTVLGPISISDMGTTLAHEHILVDFIGADSTGYHRWDKEQVTTKALPFLEEVHAKGCMTFMECTPAYLGRDPELLKILSEKSGLNIITNTGFYGARENIFIPSGAFDMTPEELAAAWITEFRDGIEESGIRPGFIKIAVDRNDSLMPMQEKLIRAAALTHRETGLVIMSHTGTDKPAFDQIAVLKEYGISPEAFIWTHAQAGTLDGWIRAARMGAWISLDNVNHENLQDYLGYLVEMKSAGLLDRVLISHDSGWYRVGQLDGGEFNGYTTIFTELIPELLQNGFDDDDIHILLEQNPARAFTIRIRTHDREALK